MSIVLRFIREIESARQLERPLGVLIACRVYRPPPAIRRRVQTRSSKDSARTSNTSTTTTRRLGTMYKPIYYPDPICAARSTCVICYFTRHVQQLYCYKLLTFTFVAAGSMAASRTACELRLSCTLAHPSRFRARARTGALGLSAPSSCFHMDHELMALPEVDDVLKSSHLFHSGRLPAASATITFPSWSIRTSKCTGITLRFVVKNSCVPEKRKMVADSSVDNRSIVRLLRSWT